MSTITNTLLILCFVAGKSGGHLLPCITQAEKIIQENKSSQMYLFSSGTDLENKIMSKHKKIENYVPSQLNSIPYTKPWLFPVFIYECFNYFIHAMYKLSQINPAKIISFGGFNSVPVCLAGKLLRIPFELYELNVEPGQSIKFLSHFTDTVHICFTQTADYFPHKKCIHAPYPVRFTERDKIYNKDTLLKEWKLDPTRKTILILGGSQGSIFINHAIKECLETDKSLANTVQVIHQIGIYDQDNYKEFYEKHKISAVIFTYNEQLQNFYNLADVIICRAGAGTLFEVNFFKKPCIIIPLQTDLNDHQCKNAYAMEKMYPNKFSVILQNDETTSILQSMLTKIIL